MQINRQTDYGLRILLYLALKPKGELTNIDEVSEVYGISRNNINKLVHQLGKAEVLATKRGKGGGFYLNQAPEDINLGKMVRLLENSLEVIDCNTPVCRIRPACRVKSVLNEATHAFMKVLEQYSLQDMLTEQRDNLIQIFDLADTSG